MKPLWSGRLLWIGSALGAGCAASGDSGEALIGPSVEETAIAGTLEQGRYRAPMGRFSIAIPPLFQPGSQASDGFDGDAFSVRFRDQLGQRFEVEVLPLGEEALRATLEASLGALSRRHGNATLAHEEEVRTRHAPSLFAVVEVEGGGGYRVLDASSQGEQRVEGLFGLLLFDRSPHRYILSAKESLLIDLGSKSPPGKRERWRALREGLDELASTMRFDGS